MAAVLKTVIAARQSRVQISAPPPTALAQTLRLNSMRGNVFGMTRPASAFLIGVFAASCGSSGTVSSPQTASASRTHRSASATSAASCKIPVSFNEGSSDSGYFLGLPGGSASSPVKIGIEHSGSSSQTTLETVDTPILRATAQVPGNGNWTFDRKAGRWVPAPWRSISPDGETYSYSAPDPNGTDRDIHLVDVTTGDDRVVLSKGNYEPLQLDAATLYLRDYQDGSTWNSGGLYAFNVSAQALRVLHPGGGSAGPKEGWIGISGGYAYGYAQNPDDPTPPGSGEAPDEIVKLEVSSGLETQVVYHPGSLVYVLGFGPDGRVIADTALTGIELLTSSGGGTLITGLPSGAYLMFFGGGQAWFASTDTPPQLFQLSSGATTTREGPMTDSRSRLSGTCA
jgi:hypothetical protein